MKVRKEIELYADEADKPVLLGLLDKYHMESTWSFVAVCAHRQYGPLSYESHCVWSPTEEGRVIYEHLINKGKVGV